MTIADMTGATGTDRITTAAEEVRSRAADLGYNPYRFTFEAC